MAEDERALWEHAQEALFNRIIDLAPQARSQAIANLAEAYAWAMNPAQAHGGSTTVTTK